MQVCVCARMQTRSTGARKHVGTTRKGYAPEPFLLLLLLLLWSNHSAANHKAFTR